ncbi:MAG TPA: hypothetical protein VKI44_41370 [Acetobacteraceae bacterium]|nr:hypothetical protein [Acetobacteraceae bacterium]
MADILIRGGDTEATANELAAAIRDIFAVEPIRTVAGSGQTPGTRGLVEAALIILALPPAAHHAATIVAGAQLGERLRRLIAKVAALRKSTRSTVLIDPGDGKHIPLEEASHEAIVTALHRIEQRLKT